MEAFNGEDVDPLARTAFRIVFMDAKGEHIVKVNPFCTLETQ